MSDTLEVLVAAFGGGLFGAVAQPVLEFGLQRLRAAEEQRKKTESRLRGQMEVWLDHGFRHAARALMVVERQNAGRPFSDEQLLKLFSAGDPGLWPGSRIRDPELRRKGEEYFEAVNQLCIEGLGRSESKELSDLVSKVSQLGREISEGMDQLKWPEPE